MLNKWFSEAPTWEYQVVHEKLQLALACPICPWCPFSQVLFSRRAVEYVFILSQGTKGEDSARNLGVDQTTTPEPPRGRDLLQETQLPAEARYCLGPLQTQQGRTVACPLWSHMGMGVGLRVGYAALVLRTGLAVQVSSDFPCIPRENQNLESPGDPWNWRATWAISCLKSASSGSTTADVIESLPFARLSLYLC